MHPEPAHSYARLSCRVSSHIKHQAEAAAAILGLSITDFTESAIADKAHAVLERNARISLSERDFSRFLVAIENPEPPTHALREAVADYRRLKKQRPEDGL